MDMPAIAVQAAQYATDNLFEEHRGAMRWKGQVAIFGNDGYETEETKLEVTILRQHLEEKGIQELGFGVADDGYTWAMIVDSENLDLLKGLVVASWEAAKGLDPNDPWTRAFKKAQGLDDVDRDGSLK
jgi:hypothetical protein